MSVPELAAADPASLLALARRLVDFDLTTTTRIGGRVADDPMIWWAGGPRTVRTTTNDGLWLRLVDVGAALSQRGYAAAVDVVLDVADPVCPWNQRRWRLRVATDGVGTCVPTEDRARPAAAGAGAGRGVPRHPHPAVPGGRGFAGGGDARVGVAGVAGVQRRPAAGRRLIRSERLPAAQASASTAASRSSACRSRCAARRSGTSTTVMPAGRRATASVSPATVVART